MLIVVGLLLLLSGLLVLVKVCNDFFGINFS